MNDNPTMASPQLRWLVLACVAVALAGNASAQTNTTVPQLLGDSSPRSWFTAGTYPLYLCPSSPGSTSFFGFNLAAATAAGANSTASKGANTTASQLLASCPSSTSSNTTQNFTLTVGSSQFQNVIADTPYALVIYRKAALTTLSLTYSVYLDGDTNALLYDKETLNLPSFSSSRRRELLGEEWGPRHDGAHDNEHDDGADQGWMGLVGAVRRLMKGSFSGSSASSFSGGSRSSYSGSSYSGSSYGGSSYSGSSSSSKSSSLFGSSSKSSSSSSSSSIGSSSTKSSTSSSGSSISSSTKSSSSTSSGSFFKPKANSLTTGSTYASKSGSSSSGVKFFNKASMKSLSKGLKKSKKKYKYKNHKGDGLVPLGLPATFAAWFLGGALLTTALGVAGMSLFNSLMAFQYYGYSNYVNGFNLDCPTALGLLPSSAGSDCFGLGANLCCGRPYANLQFLPYNSGALPPFRQVGTVLSCGLHQDFILTKPIIVPTNAANLTVVIHSISAQSSGSKCGSSSDIADPTEPPVYVTLLRLDEVATSAASGGLRGGGGLFGGTMGALVVLVLMFVV